MSVRRRRNSPCCSRRSTTPSYQAPGLHLPEPPAPSAAGSAEARLAAGRLPALRQREAKAVGERYSRPSPAARSEHPAWRCIGQEHLVWAAERPSGTDLGVRTLQLARNRLNRSTVQRTGSPALLMMPVSLVAQRTIGRRWAGCATAWRARAHQSATISRPHCSKVDHSVQFDHQERRRATCSCPQHNMQLPPSRRLQRCTRTV
jgi:hypothetical protein